jgi:hypothetical protein
MNRRGRVWPCLSLNTGLFCTALAAAVLGTGCGEEEFADEAYGAIDLAPYFFDGSTAANPTAGLPREIAPKRGWIAGQRAEFYDFGLVNFARRRTAAGVTLAEPDTGRANPIYFFFDRGSDLPLASRPVYDQRTGTFNMRGGKDTLNVNPRGPNGDNDTHYFELPYSARARNTVVDPRRRSDDYQRPIIDKLHNDTNYSGLWEVVLVRVDSGYTPDTIKSYKTLKSFVDAGKATLEPTGKVINCPVLDDRTWVTPSGMAYQKGTMGKPGQAFMEVQPRIEVWFRTKLGSCFLSTGWETIGRTNNDDPRNLDNVELLKGGEIKNDGLDTFDVIRFDVGQGKNLVKAVVVPVGKHYIPKVTVPNLNPLGGSSDVRYAHDDMEMVRPRHFPEDPPGYSPLVWLHDITVPQDPPYQGGTYKTLDVADPQRVAPRAGPFVKNFPVAGISTSCKTGEDACGGTPFELSCNPFPDIDLSTSDPPTGKNIADVAIEREGGPRCDVKKVDFGGYCAPGIARCESHVGADSDDKPALEQLQPGTAPADKKSLLATAGPSFSLPAVPAAVADPGPLPMMPTPEQQKAFDAYQKYLKDKASADTKIKYYADNGYTKNYIARGYACHPSTGGYCYLRCDGGASGAGAGKDIYKKDGKDYGSSADDVKELNARMTRNLKVQGASVEKAWMFNYDNRCGGASMLGYLCSSTRPNRQRVCLRECTTRNTEAENREICGYQLNDEKSPPMEGADAPYRGAIKFGSNADATDKLPGQTCNNLQGATACSWNPDFEPQGPSSRWPQ